MNEREAVARYFGMANDATDSPRGMDSARESLLTSSVEVAADQIPLKIANGPAENATSGAITPGHNSRLSDEQAAFMAQIRRTRKAGMLPDLHAIDILIGIVEELIRG